MGLGVCRAYNIPRRPTAEHHPEPRDRPLENSPLLEFVCLMWMATMDDPAGWGASRRTGRVHLKYLNGLISSIVPKPERVRAGTRDDVNSRQSRREMLSVLPSFLDTTRLKRMPR